MNTDMEHISNIGSATDISIYLKNGNYGIEYLTKEIEYERKRRNRIGVIALYERRIKKMEWEQRKKQ